MPPAPPNEPQWPPRSPHEVLASTPGGRDRLRRLTNRTSPSPSPLRRGRANSTLSVRSLNLQDEMDDQEDEDEETLQLKLQEIQARLRLKKLQSARERTAGAVSPRRRSPPQQSRPTSRDLGFGASRVAPRPESQAAIEVPVSPVRKTQPAQPQTSPSRVLLGIDKGLKGKDVSLKRAPSVLRRNANSQDGQHFGGYLQRSRTPAPQSEIQRPLSFNERLAAARTQEVDRQELRDRVRQARSGAFEIGQREIEQFKEKAVDLPEQPDIAPQFSREDILGGKGKPEHEQRKLDTMPSLPATAPKRDDPQGLYEPPPDWMMAGLKPKVAPADVPEAEASAFEPYSSFHLSQRILPHQVLTRTLSGKKIFKMPELLRQVKGPDFQLPDIEQDIVVFAIVAKRSEPRQHKPRPDQKGKQSDRGKYMVITLCDLKWELELFLFNSGFTRFWKLTEGTVLAILNPTIMPPPVGREATGKFSLVINSDADTVIEIGKARDLGFCKSVKKDGEFCNSWVNKKRTQFCEFHTNEAVSKQRATRMEVNSMDFGGIGERHRWNSREIRKPEPEQKHRYDRDTHSHWFATKSMSSAQLIDGAQALADRREKEEGLKRRMLAQERERGIMQRLSKIGAGAGKEYMKQSERARDAASASALSSSAPSASAIEERQRIDARNAVLMVPRSKELAIHLSPIKRKRPQSAQSGSSIGAPSLSTATGAKSGFGWGGNLKDKLAKMKDGDKLSNDKPPVRKKTRFVTEKGIREAGRESLGMDLPQQSVSFEDDDDDDLIIV
ncbi:primase zinc finger protein [Colletotrichum sublineola]|uniref:Putative primase zinc finger n=1 Tax=Colletotrichum sublineola TaxID=1173701 RepID=A0A066XWF8_COLSU|nr:primase zinc finger protein [Colletotrichum sublineola]KDN72044.1 putative primase zinc finger [Colletotrichum sublineola]